MGRTDGACVRLIALAKTILGGDPDAAAAAADEASALLLTDGFEQVPAWEPPAASITIEDFGTPNSTPTK